MNVHVPFRFVARACSRHRTALLFVMAVFFGGMAVSGVRSYVADRVAAEKALLVTTQPTTEVVVARRDLDRGEVVSFDTMAVREVPADVLPTSAVRPGQFDRYDAARLAQPMRSGEPLLASSIVGADAGAFSSHIRQGIRAMSVLVDEVNSLSGMLQPGDRIDLLFTVRPPVAAGQSPAQEVTTTLMQDLAVLATGRQIRAGADDPVGASRHFTSITVEVSPAQAQKLIVAQRTGKLTAMLRHPDDRRPLAPSTLDLNALLGIAPVRRVAAELPEAGPQIIVGGRGVLVAQPLLAHAPGAAQVDARRAPIAPRVEPAAPDEAVWSLRRFDVGARPQPAAPPRPATPPQIAAQSQPATQPDAVR